jgi:hypothetical protein
MNWLAGGLFPRDIIGLGVVLFAAAAQAESKPPVERVAQRAVLIVKCQTEIEDGMLNYRVLESWKGKYSPDLFYIKPRAGYLYLRGLNAKGRGDVKAGQEVIFIYSDNALSGDTGNKGKIHANHPDDVLPVVSGKVDWQPGEPDSIVNTVEDLKKAILAASLKVAKPPAREN